MHRSYFLLQFFFFFFSPRIADLTELGVVRSHYDQKKPSENNEEMYTKIILKIKNMMTDYYYGTPSPTHRPTPPATPAW